MLGNFSPFYCRQQIFFKTVSKNSLGNTIRAWIQIRHGLDLGANCLQSLSADNKICRWHVKVVFISGGATYLVFGQLLHGRRHCVVSLSKNINPGLVLVQPRKTRPFITERLSMGRKESNQTNKQTNFCMVVII